MGTELTDKQISDFIEETSKEDFPWFPPEEGEAIEEDQRSYNSEPPQSPNMSISEAEQSPGINSPNNNPGFDLFDSDTENEPSSGSESSNYDEEHYLLSPNAVPDLSPYQSDIESDHNSDMDQFLLNAEDILSEDTDSDLYSEADTETELDHNDFSINDEYIDDDLEPVSEHEQEIEPIQNHNEINFDPEYDSDLDHYLVGPDGIYLDQSPNIDTESEMSYNDNDLVIGLDPEPSPGPVDPG